MALKRANIIAVVGARLNSSRLPRKHLLQLAGAPLIARIFERLDRVDELDGIVLATTADHYNQPLVEWARTAGRAVFAYQGDVNDLVGRVDAVVRRRKAAGLVYVCGDSPLIEPTTLNRIIAAWRARPTADIAHASWRFQGRPYIHEGFEFFARHAWDRLVVLADQAPLREHVGASLRPHYSRLQRVEFTDQAIFYRLKHRISVDTVSDYKFMSRIYEDWYADHAGAGIVSLPWVIQRLTNEPQLAAINRQVHQKTVDERSAKVVLVTDAAKLAQAVTQARRLQDQVSAGCRLVILGELTTPPADLALIEHVFAGEQTTAERYLRALVEQPPDVLLLMAAPAQLPAALSTRLTALAQRPPEPKLAEVLQQA